MLSKISTKHQVVIPKEICAVFGLVKGDVIDFRVSGGKIILVPKEVILKDKYPTGDLKVAEKVLAKGGAGKERIFMSGEAMLRHFKRKTKKS